MLKGTAALGSDPAGPLGRGLALTGNYEAACACLQAHGEEQALAQSRELPGIDHQPSPAVLGTRMC